MNNVISMKDAAIISSIKSLSEEMMALHDHQEILSTMEKIIDTTSKMEDLDLECELLEGMYRNISSLKFELGSPERDLQSKINSLLVKAIFY